MDRFLQHIEAQKAKTKKQIAKLQDELEKLDFSERQYRASGAATAPSDDALIENDPGFNIPPPFNPPPHLPGFLTVSPPPLPLQGTIKERVIALLDVNPNGLTSGQILNNLRFSLPALMRESLSPQLSRLKKDGEISLDQQTSLWTRAPNKKTEPGKGSVFD
jgi:hypothetical protein